MSNATNIFEDVAPSYDCDAAYACKDFQNYEDVADHADDATWILTSSFVILTMQTGFGMVEMGSSMAGFEVHILMKNAVDVFMGALGYWLLGYGLSYGLPSSPFMGLGSFAPTAGYDPAMSGLRFSQYIFQFSFAATATTIVSGCAAMRMRFFVYCLYSFFAVIFYAFVAHWLWAEDGWLNTMGAYDFAGGGPVHLFGGMNGLVAILMLGPRTGLFDGKRPKSCFRPISPSSQLFGLFMLWWGWIGFNCGSSFGITGKKWVVATRAAISTINASAGGGIVSILYSYIISGRKLIKVEHMVEGILGSLVATSPTCSVINTHESILVGAIGALIPNLIKHRMKLLHLDDPVGGVGVHVGGGIWGVIAVGFFADAELPGVEVRNGLFHGGGFEQLGLQLLEIFTMISWSLTTAIPFFYICGVIISRDLWNPRKGLRMTLEEEIEGADKFLHGLDIFEDLEETSKEAVMERRRTSTTDIHFDPELGQLVDRNKMRTSIKRKRFSLGMLPAAESYRKLVRNLKEEIDLGSISDSDDDNFLENEAVKTELELNPDHGQPERIKKRKSLDSLHFPKISLRGSKAFQRSKDDLREDDSFNLERETNANNGRHGRSNTLQRSISLGVLPSSGIHQKSNQNSMSKETEFRLNPEQDTLVGNNTSRRSLYRKSISLDAIPSLDLYRRPKHYKGVFR